MPQARPSQAYPAAAPALTHVSAIVKTVSGMACQVDIAGSLRRAAIATHIVRVVPGQRVAVLDGGCDDDCLVVAAWPMDGEDADGPLHFDAATGTLHIQAARVSLAAVARIDLQCGPARVGLSLDGKVHIEGNEVLSAAIGSNRIEGASIDLN